MKKKTKDNPKKDVFNFDEEIIIGVTKKPKNNNVAQKQDNKKQNKKPKKTQKTNNRKITKIVKWLVLLLLLIGAIIYILLSPLFNIVEINVENNNKLSTEQIISLSGIQKGENTFKLDKAAIVQMIKENPYISDVKIIRNLPSTVIIDVNERTTQYLLEIANSYVYVDNQGYMLEISETKPELPILIGFSTSQEELRLGNRMCLEDLKKLDKTTEITKSATNNGIISLITKIDISDENNYKLILENEGKTVYLGNCTDINIRILYLKSIIEKERGVDGEVFINGNMNEHKVFFREKV